MKKILNFVLKIIAIIFAVIVANYVLKVVNIYEFIDQKVIPVLVGIVSAVASIFSLLKPVFNKLDLSNINLQNSLNETNKIIEENNKLKSILTLSNQKVENLEKELKVLIEIVKIGFSQNEENVINGKANLICKKEVENEKT